MYLAAAASGLPRATAPVAGRPSTPYLGGLSAWGRSHLGRLAAGVATAGTLVLAAGMSAGWLDAVPLLHPMVAKVVEVLGTAALVGSWFGARRRWLTRTLPVLLLVVAVLVGLIAAGLRLTGTVTDGYPPVFGVWVGLGLAAIGSLVVAPRGPYLSASPRMLRQVTAVVAVPLTAAGAFLLINDNYGVWPRLGDVLDHEATISRTQLNAAVRAPVGTLATLHQDHGVLVALDAPARRSHFTHRPGRVYLPPAYFTSARANLPVLVMLPGTPGAPTAWAAAGRAVATADAVAAAHGGVAPVLVFADNNGSTTGDTECVDGPRGNAETYLVVDVPAFVTSTLHVSNDPARWGVAGFSEGGTCALHLVLRHPDVYRHLVDLAGDARPTLGGPAHTRYALFGGSAAEAVAHDPAHLLATRTYPGVTAWFVAGQADRRRIAVTHRLAPMAARAGVVDHVVTVPGGHSWQFASAAFAQVLPLLVQELRPAAVAGWPGRPEPSTVVCAPGAAARAPGRRPLPIPDRRSRGEPVARRPHRGDSAGDAGAVVIGRPCRRGTGRWAPPRGVWAHRRQAAGR